MKIKISNVDHNFYNFGKSFNQLTKDTVKAFLEDSKKSKFQIK